jgi:hypothetical protein
MPLPCDRGVPSRVACHSSELFPDRMNAIYYFEWSWQCYVRSNYRKLVLA